MLVVMFQASIFQFHILDAISERKSPHPLDRFGERKLPTCLIAAHIDIKDIGLERLRLHVPTRLASINQRSIHGGNRQS